MANGWITDTLILLPLGGAIFIALAPLARLAAGLVALAVSLVEIAFWGGALNAFDYHSGASVQLQDTTTWFGELGISYHVGFTGFAIWLVGLAAIVMTAAIAYAVWVGRERARAYFASMLLLTAAIVGVFAAQDYLLFYVFWEAMLIPLYVLVGVWGGPGRLRATLMFFIYTMAGSLLMLASIIVLGISHHSFDMVGPGGFSNSNWIFLGFVAAFVVKAPLFPFHAWLPDAYREAPPEVAGVLSGVVSKAAAYGFLYVAILHFPDPARHFRTPILVLAAIGLVYGSLLAFRASDFRGVMAYSSLAQLGLITFGLFATNLAGFNGAVLQMVNHGLISAAMFMLAGLIELRAGTGKFDRLGGMAKGRPALATVLMTLGIIALAVPGSSAFAGEFMILTGVFTSGWAWSVIGAIAIVLAAMYMLRLISAVLHRSRGVAVTDEARDLRLPELAVLVPLLACLIFLSAWPAAVTDHTFGQSSGTPGLARLVSTNTYSTASGNHVIVLNSPNLMVSH
ncbi:MAG TPA: NADH-quinone oxidoreductase subunit M [Gaiellaceae bacterium]|nr:NADH-quinone oxidoreductase subunit M [Gaiellaceae bacterium]